MALGQFCAADSAYGVPALAGKTRLAPAAPKFSSASLKNTEPAEAGTPYAHFFKDLNGFFENESYT